MIDTWINIRFGTRHLILGKGFKCLTFKINDYHVQNKPEKAVEVYSFFGLV